MAEDNKDDKLNESKICIPILHGEAYLWNPNDIKKLWTDHRIIGSLIGTLPKHPHQSQQYGLPLKLLPEETTLAKENGIAKLIDYPQMIDEPDLNMKEKFLLLRKQNYEQQVVAALNDRKKEIDVNVDEIVKGKRRKIEQRILKNPNYNVKPQDITREQVIASEIEKIKKLPEGYQCIQTFIEHPFIDEMTKVEAKWDYPSTDNEKLKYKVFKNLWKRNYYLTSGLKFGGDFAVYTGDPIMYHASCIVRCVKEHEVINPIDLIAAARVGTSVKKTFVLAYEDSKGNIKFQTLRWFGGEIL